jgi:hypothetical protein
MTQATALARRLNRLGAQVPYDLVVLAARVFPAMVYWQSARTKVDGLTIKDQTYFLFEHVYALAADPARTCGGAGDRGGACACRSCWSWACFRACPRWACW